MRTNSKLILLFVFMLFIGYGSTHDALARNNKNNQTDFNLDVTAAQTTINPGQTEQINIAAEADQRAQNYHLIVTITFDGNVVERYREEVNFRANKTIQRHLGWRVPKNAPDGTYTVTAVIRHDGDILEQDTDTFTVGSGSSSNGSSSGGTTGGGSSSGGSTPSPVAGQCGSANNVAVATAPTNNLCAKGTVLAFIGSGPWNWTCAGSNGGTDAQCTASKTPTVIIGACGTATNVAVSNAPTTGLCSTGTASSVSGNGPWNWTCAASNNQSVQCTAPKIPTQTPVNGVCGAANNTSVASKPTTGLCTAGTASSVSGNSPWLWTCTGSNGGSTAQCLALFQQTVTNGTCGSSNGKTFSAAPTTNLCTTGTATVLMVDGNSWIWNCVGSTGGNVAACTANMTVTKVNGQCGAANGTSVTAPPSSGLCSTGAATTVTGSSATDIWKWTCTGSGGGTMASCATVSGNSGGGNTSGWWMATPGSEWQWEIDHALDTTSASDMGTGKTGYNGDTSPVTDPMVYDIDGFDNTADTVTALHGMGKKVVCYIEVGAAENYRPDYSEFPAAALGNVMPGYSSEKYVDIRNATVVSIIEARIQMCASKGFDAVEPDIDESYGSNTGFPLTKANEETYMTTLANYAHSLGVAMWGKNPDDTGDSYAADMVNTFDAVLTEQCNEYGSCDLLSAYAGANKAVFNAEYNLSLSAFCPADNSSSNFNGVLFNVNLNGSRSPCK